MEKRCFKCGRILPIEMFYAHSKMADGHLNKCKDCTKEGVRKNRSNKIKYYRDYDKSRASDEKRVASTRRYRSSDKAKAAHVKRNARYRERNSEKYNAHKKLTAAVDCGRITRPTKCSDCGSFGKVEAHHEDYSRPLDVLWLCGPCHRLRHRKIAA